MKRLTIIVVDNREEEVQASIPMEDDEASEDQLRQTEEVRCCGAHLN